MSTIVRTNPLKKKVPGKALNYQEVARKIYMLYETVWADAWPHLDDWFTTGALLSTRSRSDLILV